MAPFHDKHTGGGGGGAAVLPSNAIPTIDGGAGAAGVSALYSRGDHQHPAGPNGIGWLNVRDFGAVGNGIADDAPAFHAALNAAIAAFGGVVYFPPGTYRMASSIVANAPALAQPTIIIRGTGGSSQ